MFIQYFAEAQENYEVLRAKIFKVVKDKGGRFYSIFGGPATQEKGILTGPGFEFVFYNMGLGKVHIVATLRDSKGLEVWEIARETELFHVTKEDDPDKKWVRNVCKSDLKTMHKIKHLFYFAVHLQYAELEITKHFADLHHETFDELDIRIRSDGCFQRYAKILKGDASRMSDLYPLGTLKNYYQLNKDKLHFPE